MAKTVLFNSGNPASLKWPAIIVVLGIVFLMNSCRTVQGVPKVTTQELGKGWAANAVNATIFRKNSLFSAQGFQFAAYYDVSGQLVIAKRSLSSTVWELQQTVYSGNIRDAHNSISMIVDGAGYLHLAWDQHNNTLNYSRSKQPFSLDLGEKQSMTGELENSVTYPEFYRLPNGDLLFCYRDGASGKGNLVINRYHCETETWTRLQNNLIDGEGRRSAYWQACVDESGTIHLSWVWRETPDVASNHDLCYARSRDGGRSWEKSTGEHYRLPIVEKTAERIWEIPAGRSLINQTAICADESGNPYIATYFQETASAFPQYQVIYKNTTGWKKQNLGFRKTGFSLSGGGTKKIPISRPQLLTRTGNGNTSLILVFRDADRGNRASVAINRNVKRGNNWVLYDLNTENLGDWEPSYDPQRWSSEKILNLFVQQVLQGDGERITNLPAQPVSVLEWKP